MPKEKSEDLQEETQTLSFNNSQQIQATKTQAPQSNFSIEFGDQPVQMKCPFCLQKIKTELILKPELISIVLGFFMFVMAPNLFMFFLVVIVLQLTATRKHRCGLCQRQLGSDGKFLMFFKDQVYSFVIGSNGLIISKKILVTIGMIAFTVGILFLRVSNIYADVVWTDLTWKEFYKQCPQKVTSAKCLRSNEGLTVRDWKGLIMRVEDNRQNRKRYFESEVMIFIKMSDQNTKQINRQMPDFLMCISMSQIHVFSSILDEVSHGDEIVFNATFKNLRRGQQKGIPEGRHFSILNIQKTGHRDKQIHVFMTPEQDKWFFQASNQKLRKHEEDQEQKLQLKDIQQLQREGDQVLKNDNKLDQQ